MVNFRLIDKYTQCEIIYSELKKHEFGTIAEEISKKVGCNPKTAKKVLDYFVKVGLVKSFKIGRYTIYLTKDLKKRLNIRKHIEDLDKNALSKN